MIRVLHIIDNINIDAGVSSVVMNIYRFIDRNLIQFDFLVSHIGNERGKTYAMEIDKLGGHIYYFGAPLSFPGILTAPNAAKKFFKNNYKSYDVVHLHTPTIAEFTIKYARRYGIKYIITHSHSTITSLNPIKSAINSYLITRIKKYSSDYWACSTEAAKFMFGGLNINNINVNILKNAIGFEQFAFNAVSRKLIRQELGLLNKIVLIHVSNFSPIKNLEFIVPIIKEISRLTSNYHFIFVGNGPTKKNIEGLVELNKLSNFCLFIGQTDDVKSYLQAADAFFLPSLSEGFGVSAVEAQASGLKCLLSETITREVNAGLVDFLPLNTETWVKYILDIEIIKDEERTRLSHLLSQSDFNMKNEIEKIQSLYTRSNHLNLQ